MDLAHRMKELREEAGLTKTALARPGYSVGYVTQIEQGLRTPSPKALSFFAAKLGVTPNYLATGVPEDLEESLRYQLEEGRQALRDGRTDQVEAAVRPVVKQAEQYGLVGIGSEGLSLLGHALALEGRHREAVDTFEGAIEGELPVREEGMTVGALARSYRAVGDLAYAAQVVEAYLDTKREPPLDAVIVAHLQSVLLSVYFERGDILRAERAARRALTAADAGAPPYVRAGSYWNASRVLAEARRWDEALDYATRARLIMEQVDDQRDVARLHNAYAFICLEADPPRTEEARWHLDRAETLLREGVAAPGDLAYVQTERARLALLEARPSDAVASAEEALAHAGDDELEIARCLFLKGRGLAALGRSKEAEADLGRAAVLFGDRGARQQEAACWREIGEMHLDSGEVEAAVLALRAGLEALDPRRSRA
jgi:tetratricopeptide (TPR) repeat protein